MTLGTSNCANYSTRKPKTQCKVCLHTGTSASSTARAGTSFEKEQRKKRNLSSTPWISSRFLTTTFRKGDLTGTVTGRSQETASTTSRIRSRRNAKRSSTWVSTIDLYEMKNSAGIWLKLVEPKIFVAKWMILRTKIIPTIWLHKKSTITKVIGGLVRTRLVPIPCRSGTDMTSNKHCLRFQQLKEKEEEARRNQSWAQSSSSSTMVELARFLVDSLFLWKSPWRRTQYWLIMEIW